MTATERGRSTTMCDMIMPTGRVESPVEYVLDEGSYDMTFDQVNEVMLAVGTGTIGAGAYLWWADPAKVVLGVPSAYTAAFGIGIGFAIVLRALGIPRDER